MIMIFIWIVVPFAIISLTTAERSWDEAYNIARMLVSQMTIDEKITITTGTDGPCVGNIAKTPHFGPLCLNDGPLGVRGSSKTSAFVAGINAAASFDRGMIRQRGADIAEEFRGKGINVWLGPSTDLLRLPRSGRGWEGFGEDPYLSGVAGAESIKGAQSQGVIATVKHYTAYNQETNRKHMSSNVDNRTLHELYLWPYARAIEAGVGAVMCAYNKINNVYACENSDTLTRDLRVEMGFKGWVMSDWDASFTAVKGANAGLDMDMPGDNRHFGASLRAAVKKGKVSEERLNEMVESIVATYYKLEQDNDFPQVQINTKNPSKDPAVDVQGSHKNGIRAIGAASTILLRNTDGVLPIRADNLPRKRLVVAGTDAGSGILPPNLCPAHMCNTGTLAMGGGSGSASFPYLITPLEGITERAKRDSLEVKAILNDVSPVSDLLTIITTTISPTDTCIVFGNAYATEAFDRPFHCINPLHIPIIKHISNACKNTIVVIHSGGPVDIEFVSHPNIKAIIWAGLPGQESGHALADILFGDVNPSGRLPYTIAKSHNDYPADVSLRLQVPYEEKLLLGYKWFDAKGIDPLFEFGFGLSYTTFAYRNVEVNVAHQELVTASVSISNTGSVDGAEVAQLYITFPESAGEPPKLLRGFEKIFLKKGEGKSVQFQLTKTELSIWDEQKQDWVIPSGKYTLHIGSSSRDLHGQDSFSL